METTEKGPEIIAMKDNIYRKQSHSQHCLILNGYLYLGDTQIA